MSTIEVKSTIARKGMILAGVPLTFELIFIVVLLVLFTNAEKTSARALQSKVVIAEADSLFYAVMDQHYAVGNAAALGQSIDTEKIYNLLPRISKQMDTMRSLIGNDKAQLQNLREYEKVLQSSSKDLVAVASGFEEGEPFAARIYSVKVSRYYNSLRALSQKIIDAEMQKQATIPLLNERSRMLLTVCVIAGIVMNIGIAIALATFFGKAISGRISAILANIQRMNEGKELVVPQQGNDEIAVIDKELFDMASFIAETRKKEQALVGNVRSVICSLTKDLKFAKVSEEAVRTWERTLDQFDGLHLEELCKSQDWEGIARQFESYTKSREPSGQIDMQMFLPSSKSVWMHWSIFWSKEHDSFFCVANDITEQKKLSEMKHNFTQMISHDLRTPLQSIQVFFEVLEGGLYGAINERGAPRIVSLKRSVSHLIRLINNLLDLEKMDAGQLDLVKEDCNLKEMVESSFEFMSELAQNREIRLVLDIDEDATVNVDRDKLIQIFQNLLGNAVKYAPPATEITVKSRVRGSFMEIEIIDQGKGIPLDQQDKIFERFHQVRDSGGKASAGSGLGLAFCKQFVDLHGGQIGVESTEGKGSTFWLLLPVH